jgi:predicted Zn finger-like uncharacterized protein
MSASLATRCPACQTVFRVVPDQLRVSEGWVRCGRCAEVFNASEHFVDATTGVPSKASIEVRTRLPEPAPAEDDRGRGPAGASAPTFGASAEIPLDGYAAGDATAREGEAAAPSGLASAAAASAPGAAWGHAGEESAAAPGGVGASATVDIAAGTATSAATSTTTSTSISAATDKTTAPPAAAAAAAAASTAGTAPRRSGARATPTPSFVRQAERAERWRRPGVRAALLAGVVAATVLLGLQSLVLFRDQSAARWPELKPLIAQLCAPFGCRVEPVRAIEALVVESSGLVRVEKSDLYKLSVALRNQRGHEVAVPAIDLKLTDTQGRLIARRVLRASELGIAGPVVRADTEIALAGTLQIASAPVAGYTIELFYP